MPKKNLPLTDETREDAESNRLLGITFLILFKLAFILFLMVGLLSVLSGGKAEAATPRIGEQVKVNVDVLNVRSGAGTEYSVIDRFHYGEITEVGGYFGAWLIVKTHNPYRYGYVYGAYVSPVKSTVSRSDVVNRYNNVSRGGNYSYSRDDLYWLSRIVSAEAKGESFEGMVAVANVILNRVNSGQFPDTVKGVVFERSIYGFAQFSPVDDGSIYYDPTPQAVEAARQALSGYNIVPSALYFYNPDKTDWGNWIRTRPIIARIGNHVFAM